MKQERRDCYHQCFYYKSKYVNPYSIQVSIYRLIASITFTLFYIFGGIELDWVWSILPALELLPLDRTHTYIVNVFWTGTDVISVNLHVVSFSMGCPVTRPDNSKISLLSLMVEYRGIDLRMQAKPSDCTISKLKYPSFNYIPIWNFWRSLAK